MAKKAPWQNRIVGDGEEDPEQLLASPWNWRIHPQFQQESLGVILDRVGFVQKVIVNRTTGHVVDGHMRVELAISKGQPTIPVVYVELTEEEEREILMAFDPIATMAGTDRDLLRQLVDGVHADGDARMEALLKDMRHRSQQMRGWVADPDDVPEVPETHTERGMLYALGQHRLLCGDATSAEDVARLMGEDKAQMIFTDPPYGVDYEGSSSKRRTPLKGDAGSPALLYREALRAMRPHTRDDAAAYVWFAILQAEAALGAIREAGLVTSAVIMWVKNNPTFSLRHNYKQKHEPLAYAHWEGKRPAWHGLPTETTVWDADRSARNDYHPTQKPVALAERAIQNSSLTGEVVYDGFGGSGSTLIACERLERRCRMMELDPHYVDVIVARWEAFTGEQAVLVE